MTLPDKAIEAGCKALLETNPDRFAGEYLVAYVEPIIQAALQSLWQPIESAPRDGSEIWAYNGEWGRMKYLHLDLEEGGSLWGWADETLADVDPAPEQPTHFIDPSIFPIPHPKGEG